MNQQQQVLNHLRQHGSITSWDAITHYHITRLSAYIFNLKEAGHDISSDTEVGDSGKKYARYTLHKDSQACLFKVGVASDWRHHG